MSMSKDENLSKINLFDKLNAQTLGMVTKEMPRLKKARKLNGYVSNKPTFNKPFEMPFDYVDVSGINIRVAIEKKDDTRPNLVMLSPYPQSIMAFAPMWEKLKNSFNLYAYDLPGFGRSQRSDNHMTFKAQGEFLKSFIEYYNIKSPHLFGPDVGMPAIIYYVGTFKNVVKSLIVGDGPAISPSANASMIKKMVNSGFWRTVFKVAGSGALIEGAKLVCYTNYVPNKYEESDYKKSYDGGKVAPTMIWFKDYEKSIADTDPLIDKIEQPTLIFWGDEDAILYPENGERMHERMKNSELKIFKNTGHFSYLDRHEEFGEMLIKWVLKHK
jgi:pimeloyl-ACP methyl ester carboxylesterase